MRSNHLSAVLCSLVALPLVACGGDDDGMVVVPDAKVFMDAPADTAAAACTAPATIPALAIGTQQMPRSSNWIVNDQQLGAVVFRIASYLPNDMQNAMIIIVPRPQAGFTATTYTFDPDPNSTTAEAIAFLQANINPTTMTAERVLWASSGSIDFSAIGQTQGATITGTIATTNYREIDTETGADLPGGCTSSLTGLQFFGTQMTAVPLAPNGEVPSLHDLRNLKVDALPLSIN